MCSKWGEEPQIFRIAGVSRIAHADTERREELLIEIPPRGRTRKIVRGSGLPAERYELFVTSGGELVVARARDLRLDSECGADSFDEQTIDVESSASTSKSDGTTGTPSKRMSWRR